MFIPLKDFNPTRRPPLLVVLLILLNCSVFFYQSCLSREHLNNPLQASDLRSLAWPSSLDYHVMKSGLIPAELVRLNSMEIPVGRDQWNRMVYYQRRVPPFLSVLFSMFMHGSWLHLLGNMLFLWIFGDNIEDRLGINRFIFFYLVCGIGASLCHVLFNLGSLIPVIGASGAISGIMGAYLALFPTARVRTLVFVFFLVTTVDLPAMVFLVVWFLFQFLSAGPGSGIAWLAHVGGFIMGFLLIRFFLPGRPLPRKMSFFS